MMKGLRQWPRSQERRPLHPARAWSSKSPSPRPNPNWSSRHGSPRGAIAVNRPTVVIVSDVPEFSTALTRRWLAERSVPLFILADSNSLAEVSKGEFGLAVLGGLSTETLTPVLDVLKATGKPLIHV